MYKITNKQYEEYRQFLNDSRHGRILTPDGLRLICEALHNDPEEIGKQMLETYGKFQAEGCYEIRKG